MASFSGTEGSEGSRKTYLCPIPSCGKRFPTEPRYLRYHLVFSHHLGFENFPKKLKHGFAGVTPRKPTHDEYRAAEFYEGNKREPSVGRMAALIRERDAAWSRPEQVIASFTCPGISYDHHDRDEFGERSGKEKKRKSRREEFAEEGERSEEVVPKSKKAKKIVEEEELEEENSVSSQTKVSKVSMKAREVKISVDKVKATLLAKEGKGTVRSESSAGKAYDEGNIIAVPRLSEHEFAMAMEAKNARIKAAAKSSVATAPSGSGIMKATGKTLEEAKRLVGRPSKKLPLTLPHRDMPADISALTADFPVVTLSRCTIAAPVPLMSIAIPPGIMARSVSLIPPSVISSAPALMSASVSSIPLPMISPTSASTSLLVDLLDQSVSDPTPVINATPISVMRVSATCPATTSVTLASTTMISVSSAPTANAPGASVSSTSLLGEEDARPGTSTSGGVRRGPGVPKPGFPLQRSSERKSTMILYDSTSEESDVESVHSSDEDEPKSKKSKGCVSDLSVSSSDEEGGPFSPHRAIFNPNPSVNDILQAAAQALAAQTSVSVLPVIQDSILVPPATQIPVPGPSAALVTDTKNSDLFNLEEALTLAGELVRLPNKDWRVIEITESLKDLFPDKSTFIIQLFVQTVIVAMQHLLTVNDGEIARIRYTSKAQKASLDTCWSDVVRQTVQSASLVGLPRPVNEDSKFSLSRAMQLASAITTLGQRIWNIYGLEEQLRENFNDVDRATLVSFIQTIVIAMQQLFTWNACEITKAKLAGTPPSLSSSFLIVDRIRTTVQKACIFDFRISDVIYPL